MPPQLSRLLCLRRHASWRWQAPHRTERFPRRRSREWRAGIGAEKQADARLFGGWRADGPPSRTQRHPARAERHEYFLAGRLQRRYPHSYGMDGSAPRSRGDSVDGLPDHHDIRRKPATYERILKNIDGRKVNIHWVITRAMLQRPGYLEEYVAFWSGRPEVDRMWVSLYTPQIGEESAEKLTPEDRQEVARVLPQLARKFPKFL